MTADSAERTSNDLLSRAIDVHVHTAPDLIDRYESDLELAYEIFNASLRGVVVKSHVVPTVGRVDLINEAVGEDVLYGGIALNGSVGGLNVDTVEVALELGATIVWLPTAWSANHARQARNAGIDRFVGQRIPRADEEISVMTDGKVTESTRQIIELVAEYDAVLGTGHISPNEIEAVVDACANIGAQCLVNHPFFRIVDLPIEQQIKLAERGAVMEYCAYAVESTETHTVEQVANAIERIDPEKCLLATDFGQTENPPVPGFARFACAVREAGVPEDTIRELVAETPARLLGR
jgi:hypothetical protein